jgi:hypothetical protein
MLPGKVDQSFENTEYRYAMRDKDGMLVDGALAIQTVQRTIALPKNARSVNDATDAQIQKSKFKPGEEYFFVVSVRNLTALARFTVGGVPVGTYRAEQKNKVITVFADGKNPTAGWKNTIEVLPIDVYPTEFKFTQTKPTGIVAEVVTPFYVSASERAPTRIDFVFVHDTGGRHKVPVTQK